MVAICGSLKNVFYERNGDWLLLTGGNYSGVVVCTGLTVYKYQAKSMFISFDQCFSFLFSVFPACLNLFVQLTGFSRTLTSLIILNCFAVLQVGNNTVTSIFFTIIKLCFLTSVTCIVIRCL